MRNIITIMCTLGNMFISSWPGFRKRGAQISNARKIKQLLAVVIAFACLTGITMIAVGASNLAGERLVYDISPTGRWFVENNVFLILLGVIYFISSCFGYFGVCESQDKFTKVFMVMSLTFGFALLQMFFVWLAVIHTLIPEQKKYFVSDDRTHEFYMMLVLLSGIFQIICGFLSYLICANYVYARGYYSVTEEEAELHDFFEELNQKGTYDSRSSSLFLQT